MIGQAIIDDKLLKRSREIRAKKCMNSQMLSDTQVSWSVFVFAFLPWIISFVSLTSSRDH